MAVMRVKSKRLSVSGEVGYEGVAEFSKSCHEFMAGAGHDGGTIDLTAARELVSSCLSVIYDGARLHHPAGLTVIVPERLSLLFAPGEIEGLFRVAASVAPDKARSG
jgi:hypothetical protein